MGSLTTPELAERWPALEAALPIDPKYCEEGNQD